MPPEFPKTTIKFISALLKHQAKLWLGEDAAGIAAETLIDEDIQKRLDEWLDSDKSAKEMLKAVEATQLYLQDPQNCPDDDLRYIFRDLTFGDLPSVQAAINELPQALDSSRLEQTLLEAFTRDLPNLTAEQQKEGARLYTYALLSAVSKLEKFTSPILVQTVLDNSKKLDALGMGQDEIKALLEKVSSFIIHPSSFQQPPSPTQPGDLPPGSYIPFPRNAIFTGRVADLEKLTQTLLDSEQTGAVINQTITGMGGLGKTQLAVEFAYLYGYQFKGVHWLDLHEPEALTSQIALLGSKMSLPNFPLTLPEQVEATKNEWKQNGPRLLILDNFEDLESANAVLGELRHSNLKVLITSRRTDWAAGLGLKRLPLDEFSPAESLAFLRNYISEQRESDADLEKLAKHLGYLPLALELAGRYLEKQARLKISDYLTQLEKALEHKSMQNWKAEQKSLTGHDLSLAQTFVQSWEQVSSPTTQKLFICLGYCAPNTPIPYEIIDAALGDEKDIGDNCMAELLDSGLLKEGNSIHPLLAQYARSFDTEVQTLKLFSEAVAEIVRQTNRNADQVGDYKLFSPLLPHLRSIAEHAESASLEPAGSLWNEIGYHIKKLADYAGAKTAFERALKIDEAALGLDHPDVAIDVNNLGMVLKDLGDLAGAKTAYERAIKIWEASFGTEHPQVATGVNNLGGVLKDLGDLAGAKTAYERALKIDEAAFGQDHPNVAIRVNNLGLVQQALGDLAGAKTAFERAIKIWEASFGTEHPQVATGVNNLGGVLKDLGDLAGAKTAYERALKIDEAAFGQDHPNVAIRVNNLGLVQQALGDLAGAKTAFERALKIDEAAFGEDHPNVAIRVNNLGSVLKALGDLAGAKTAYKRALKIDEAAFGEDHPNVAIRVNNLGSVLQAMGDHTGAKAAFERALKIFEKFLPPDHPNIKIVRGNLESLNLEDS